MSLGPEVGDSAFQDVANGHVPVLAHADARRRPGGQNVAGQQSHVAGEIGEKLMHRKEHVAGVALLLVRPGTTRPNQPGVTRIALV